MTFRLGWNRSALTVMASLGIDLSAGRIYQFGASHGCCQVTLDLEGRRGASTQFIRALTLTVAAKA
jgi:hypothetical protein